MLSSVLRSKRAIDTNISIMRAFVRIRDVMAAHKDLMAELDKVKRKQGSHARRIQRIIVVINQLVDSPPARKTIGFRLPKKD